MDWPEDATQPNVVWVKFDDADTWTLPGTSEPGLYPIIPAKKGWFLDQGRKKEKMLQVNRTQLPLTPAFCITGHSSQGKTLPAVMLDLHMEGK
eukprot:2505274-Amphidinium_carterae.1